MTTASTTPGLIRWIGYFAITLLVLIPLGILITRSGAWQQGMLVYALACLGSLILFALLLILLLLPRFAAWRKAILGRALLVLPGTLLVASVLAGRGDYPPIHNITTDTADPPVFVAAQQQRGEGANPLELTPETIAKQKAGYPDLQTLRSTLSYDAAFDRALQVADDMGWDIYHQDRNAGTIEAVSATAVMAFKDDVVIRVRTNAEGTVIDLRSVSRVGVGDIGANAKRIREFQQRFAQ
tara:strand:+ start:118398 stop:119117 length:720 start_codon:yes stop_codon:yes gene_type:complete